MLAKDAVINGLRRRTLTPCTNAPRLYRLQSRSTYSGLLSSADTSACHIHTQDKEELIKQYAILPQTSASLQMLMKTGRGELLGKSYRSEAFLGRMGRHLATQRVLNQMASFLRKEIPIRLAHRIQDLDQVPYMRDMPSVKLVKEIYIDSFLDLLQVQPIQTTEDEEAFALNLERLYMKHSSVLVQMARGAYEFREALRNGALQPSHNNDHHVPANDSDHYVDDPELRLMNECQDLLDRFYTSRIGIRVLAGQYLALREDFGDDYIGMICKTTSPYDIVRQAAENAKTMCRRQYGRAPQVEISGRLDLTFAYVPTYLHYIVLELLKNALRATAETHASSINLPPVSVIIADGMDNEDVVIKIADEGGGIPRSQVDKIWSYLFTTADPAVQKGLIGGEGGDHSNNNPIAGLGYGLGLPDHMFPILEDLLILSAWKGMEQIHSCMFEGLEIPKNRCRLSTTLVMRIRRRRPCISAGSACWQDADLQLSILLTSHHHACLSFPCGTTFLRFVSTCFRPHPIPAMADR